MTTQEQVQKLKSDVRKHSVRDVLFASSETIVTFLVLERALELAYKFKIETQSH